MEIQTSRGLGSLEALERQSLSGAPTVRKHTLLTEKPAITPSEVQVENEDSRNLVDFEENDPDDPLNWSKWRKWITVALVSTTRMLVYVSMISRATCSALVIPRS